MSVFAWALMRDIKRVFLIRVISSAFTGPCRDAASLHILFTQFILILSKSEFTNDVIMTSGEGKGPLRERVGMIGVGCKALCFEERQLLISTHSQIFLQTVAN